ncbi:MAG: tRNA(Met) cytidine acetyltransferase TmcA [Thermofilum sp.]|nr:tRNA(Met) cytidine acetyltransferase TmcA [Thermofilum sp.]
MKTVALTEEAVDALLAGVKYAKRANHRVLLALVGDSDGSLIMASAEALNLFFTVREPRREGVLYVYHAFYEDGCARKEAFEKAEKLVENVAYVPYHESEKVLGRTFDAAVIDLINNLEPNDIGRLMGVVEGGGLYIIIMPSFERLQKIITRFQSTLLTPQYGSDKLRRYFERRFVNKLLEHKGVMVYDVDNKKVIKHFELPKKIRVYKKKELEIPQERKFPEEIYKMAITEDQVKVLKILEKFYEKPEPGTKRVLVLTADRGRGKSSVVGLGIAALAHRLRRAKGRCRVLVTAPSEGNVQELFKFARRGLESLGHKVEVEERQDMTVGLRAKGVDIVYLKPLEAVSRRADIVAVDEAASLQVPMLFALLRRHDRVVYSTTVHGYEGAGRGFSVRFLRRLRQLKNVEVIEYEMSEPIRYAEGDPVEEWTFDTLLLDAEPAQIEEEDVRCVKSGEVEYWIPDLEEFFLSDEKSLREFFGIYIMAHYRNNPNDLGMMMDAPHHRPRALRLKTGKIVVSIELAEEGPLDEELARQCSKGAWIMGNIIPDRVIKHYKLVDFGNLKGLRIVRIATHPDLWGMGLGSRALREVEREAASQGYDWVGAGFGVTLELLNFWVKNGYVPIHLSPERNPVSGEYSALVVKPLNERAAEFVKTIAVEFKRRLLSSLAEPYHDLSPKVVRTLLKSTPGSPVKPSLTVYQVGRLVSYAWGDMTLENCMDCMLELAKVYFMGNHSFLSEEQELLLITKVLQAKSWRVTCNQLDMPPPRAMELLRAAARAMCAHLLGIASEEEGARYLYLHLETAKASETSPASA